MSNAKDIVTQSKFFEESLRAGHSMAAVQMWQALCRKLALLTEGSDAVALAVLQMSSAHNVPALAICDDFIANGVKKHDDKNILDVAHNLDHIYGERTESEGCSSTDEAEQATQPMTPKGRSGLLSPQSSPRPTRGGARVWHAPKKSLKRVLDLTADESE